MSETHPHVAVAARLTDRLLARDADGVADVYADDFVVWRNFDGKELDKAQAVKVVRFLVSKVQELRYENVRVLPTPEGFVQQHTLVGIAPSGAPVRAEACLVAKVKDGRIGRLDEYIDSAQLAPLMG